MSSSRRTFIRKIGELTGAASLASLLGPGLGRQLEEAFSYAKQRSAAELATDEEFWSRIRMAYTVSPTVINFNNGGVSPQPLVVQQAVERYNRLSNEAPTLYMWRHLERGREALRDKLAALAGCSGEEVAINRNASEALETVIFGLKLKVGDEVILSRQGYPNMINAWKQREMRDGIVLHWLDLEFPMEDNDLIVRRYAEAVSERTKVAHLTHVINWTGQVMPVRQIADALKKRGVEILVDGAHSFAQLDFKIPDLNCDYFGTSLHKWLCAPFGSGMLYVRQGKAKDLYPLFAAPKPDSDDIRKFENLGTRSFAIEHAIAQAIEFHNMIGIERKQKRLFYLKNYWVQKAKKSIPGFRLHTSYKPAFSCAIALFSIDGYTSKQIANYIFREYSIHSVPINWANLDGVRITPNVYTLTYDLDRLLAALESFVQNTKPNEGG